MKNFLKLAELNWTLTLANRRESQAIGDPEALCEARADVKTAQFALDKHLNSKRMQVEFDKVDSRKIKKSDIEKAITAAGYDAAIMEFVG